MTYNITQHKDYIDFFYPKNEQFILSPVGSWNYNCADENSDVDSKAVIIPNMNDIVHNNCESHTHIFSNQEHCEVSDIRNFMKSIQKGNPQFLELLFSSRAEFNTELYGEEIHAFIDYRENIARCSPMNTMRAFLGMAERNDKLCNSRYEDPHASKWLYQLVRINECMKKFLEGRGYEECIVTNKREKLLEIKNSHYTPEKIMSLAESTIADCKRLYDTYISTSKEQENKRIQLLVEELVKSILVKNIKG